MVILCDTLFINAYTISIVVLMGIFTYFKWAFNYWKRKELPFLEPVIPFGNMNTLLSSKVPLGLALKGVYEMLKIRKCKHAGLYNFLAPVYMPVDPEFVKNVMQTDFQHFTDRGLYYNEEADPLSAHLFALGGQKWRHLRTKLTPTFTSGKMKAMFSILMQCSKPLEEAMFKNVNNGEAVDVKNLVARFATDVIGSCAFGLDFDSFSETNAEFRRYSQQIFQWDMFRLLRTIILAAKPEIGKWFGMRHVPKKIADFFLDLIKNTVNHREKTNVIRNDMLQLMMDLKNNTDNNEKPLTIEEVAAQAFVFFIAGFETSSSTATFCLFAISEYPDIQEKVRKEISEVLEKYNGEITYEALTNMKYMGQVIDETLRKYPPLTQITRKCVMDYKVPTTDVIIEKDTSVIVSVLGLHKDPEYFPEPEKFDPERFSEENKRKIRPCTYMPFGEGPRTCIGLRFGLMQTKLALTVLLRNFRFSINKKTKIPLVPHPRNFVLSTKDPIWFDVKKI